MTTQTIQDQLKTVQETKSFTENPDEQTLDKTQTADASNDTELFNQNISNNPEEKTSQDAKIEDDVQTINEPIYKGTFGQPKNQEELLSYTEQLERKIIEDKYKAQQNLQQSELDALNLERLTDPVHEDSMNDDKINKMFEDPKSFVEDLKADIRADIAKTEQKKAAMSDFWTDFYKKNPDLQKDKRVVQSIINEKWENIKTLPISQSTAILADESRKFITEIRRGEGERQEMENSKAINITGSNPSPVSKDAPKKQVNFVDQFKAFMGNKKANY